MLRTMLDIFVVIFCFAVQETLSVSVAEDGDPHCSDLDRDACSSFLQLPMRNRRTAVRAPCSYEIIHEWTEMEYVWDSPTERNDSIADGTYQPGNNSMTGIKVCGPKVSANCKEETIFVTVPRWATGVPATLNRVVTGANGESLLSPWPSKEAQDPTDCSKIQNVQSMEIDPDGVMWVVDVGRKYFMVGDPPPVDNSCSPKILLIDIPTKKIIYKRKIPNRIAPHNSSFLNDIVLDVPNQVAYISDTLDKDTSGIVVFDRKKADNDEFPFRKFSDNSTRPLPGNKGAQIFIQGGQGYPLINYTEQINLVGTDAIGLTPAADRVYYSHLGGFNLYSVDATLLRDFNSSDASISSSVIIHGQMPSNPDGMSFSAGGNLFFGGLTENAVYSWKPGSSPISAASSIADSEEDLWWVDTFAWNNEGSLFLVSNRLNLLLFKPHPPSYDLSGAAGANFRIIKIPVGEKSYMCAQKGVSC